MKSKQAHDAIRLADSKGYIIREDGEIISPFSGNPLSLYQRKDGYYSFGIKLNKKRVTVDVHMLVAYQKFGNAVFEEGIQVRHKDNNSKNNFPSNILIGTQSQNQMDKPPEERHRVAIIASTKLRKFDDATIDEIRKKKNNGATYKQLMTEYNISSKGTMSHIINNNYVTSV